MSDDDDREGTPPVGCWLLLALVFALPIAYVLLLVTGGI